MQLKRVGRGSELCSCRSCGWEIKWYLLGSNGNEMKTKHRYTSPISHREKRRELLVCGVHLRNRLGNCLGTKREGEEEEEVGEQERVSAVNEAYSEDNLLHNTSSNLLPGWRCFDYRFRNGAVRGARGGKRWLVAFRGREPFVHQIRIKREMKEFLSFAFHLLLRIEIFFIFASLSFTRDDDFIFMPRRSYYSSIYFSALSTLHFWVLCRVRGTKNIEMFQVVYNKRKWRMLTVL